MECLWGRPDRSKPSTCEGRGLRREPTRPARPWRLPRRPFEAAIDDLRVADDRHGAVNQSDPLNGQPRGRGERRTRCDCRGVTPETSSGHCMFGAASTSITVATALAGRSPGGGWGPTTDIPPPAICTRGRGTLFAAPSSASCASGYASTPMTPTARDRPATAAKRPTACPETPASAAKHASRAVVVALVAVSSRLSRLLGQMKT